MPQHLPDGPPSIRARARLIVNADDFGICERINAGIAAAHCFGIVTSTSLLAVGAAFEDAVRWTRLCPSLDIGVHLALVGEKPLVPSRSALIGRDGRLPSGIAALLGLGAAGRIRLADIRREWCAQIERILERGIRLTHLDSHQHVHALPRIADLAQELAAKYRIAFVRRPVEQWSWDRRPELYRLMRLGPQLFLRASWAAARLAGARPDRDRQLHFIGFCDGGRLNRPRLLRLVRRTRPGHVYELMCHPGFTPQAPHVLRWNYRHEEELQALTSPRVRSEITSRGVHLIGFKDLAISPAEI